MQKILKVTDLTKKYGKLTAVDKLSFSIEKGQIYGLLGPNGSGKSTTLGIILNVVNKTSGSFQWLDGNYSISEALKKIGAIIERPNFYPYMTAYQNLELVTKIKNIPVDNIKEKLALVGLADRQNDKFKTFSLGMKQRLAIASALLNDPEILILDEPTNGLDPKGIHEIRQIIKDVAKQGTTIILASHLLDEVEKVCDQVIILQKGKKIFEGNIEEMSLKNNWFEIQTDALDQLKELLINNPDIDSFKVVNDIVKVYPAKSNYTGKDLNKFLAQHQIYLEHIEKKQPRLEESFLEITNS